MLIEAEFYCCLGKLSAHQGGSGTGTGTVKNYGSSFKAKSYGSGSATLPLIHPSEKKLRTGCSQKI
jgi:hypothetical protein